MSATSIAPMRMKRATAGCGDEQVLPDARGEVQQWE